VIARIGGVDAAAALDHLGVLLDLYDRGMREPAPLACLTSAAYAAAARDGDDPAAAARQVWEGSYRVPGEAAEPEHELVLGGAVPFDDLLRERAREGEHGPWWDASEPRRFGRWARRLWDGLLQVEVLE
jgi:exodeoxyribonuclease V gamma subunit